MHRSRLRRPADPWRWADNTHTAREKTMEINQENFDLLLNEYKWESTKNLIELIRALHILREKFN